MLPPLAARIACAGGRAFAVIGEAPLMTASIVSCTAGGNAAVVFAPTALFETVIAATCQTASGPRGSRSDMRATHMQGSRRHCWRAALFRPGRVGVRLRSPSSAHLSTFGAGANACRRPEPAAGLPGRQGPTTRSTRPRATHCWRDWRAAARARALLFCRPSISNSGGTQVTKSRAEIDFRDTPTPTACGRCAFLRLQLRLSQPVFRMQNILQFDQASTRSSRPRPCSARPVRISSCASRKAYFDVLAAMDNLTLVRAQRPPSPSSWRKPKRNFESARATITDTHEAPGALRPGPRAGDRRGQRRGDQAAGTPAGLAASFTLR